MISFSTPAALLVLLALPALWAVALVRPGQRTLLQLTGLGLRSTAALALAGAQLLQPDHQLTVIFLLDRSGSVGPDQRARAESYLRQALASLPASARAGVVSFGQQATVERWPSDARACAAVYPSGERRADQHRRSDPARAWSTRPRATSTPATSRCAT